jgi:hypothetical protein
LETKMKKINETQLHESVKSLRQYMSEVSSQNVAEDAASIGQAVGKAAGAVGGAVAAPVRAGAEIAQGVANNAGKWWDAAKQGVASAAQGVQNFAQGAAQGAQQGWAATDPAKLVGGGQQAAAKPGTTKPAAPAKADPAVMARQKELIAAGAKIKADGVAGPATAAAEQQFGGQATVMAANAKDAAGAAAAPAGTTAPAAAPAAPAAPATAPAAAAQPEQVPESVSFSQEDSLARIIQLSR